MIDLQYEKFNLKKGLDKKKYVFLSTVTIV